MTPPPVTFGLVHGAWCGPWCWERLILELEARGHRAVAVNLPAEDPTAQRTEAYASVVAASLQGAPGDVALVGHSLGGLTIPAVAELRPVRLLVFLCAFIPRAGSSMLEQLTSHPEIMSPTWYELAGRQIRLEPGLSAWPVGEAKELFFHDCSPEVAGWAAARLRPQAWGLLDEVSLLTEWAVARSVSIVGRADRVISPNWSRRVSIEQLGRDALEMESGHCPSLSQPSALAAMLSSLVA